MVNWCQITTTRADGTQIDQHASAYNHSITKANVVEVIADGRSNSNFY
jgi:hypothetical protein